MTGVRSLSEAEPPFLDLLGERYRRRPFAEIHAARGGSWIVRTVRGLEVITYAACRELSVDRRLDSVGPQYYSDLGASEAIMWYATQASLPMIEDPRHARIRKALQYGFTRRYVDGLRPRMRAVAQRLLDRMAELDPFDLVADFTNVYPIEVLCALMGIPDSDVPRFASWTVDLGLLAKYPLEPHIPRIDAAIGGLRAYFAELIRERRTRPADDFVSTVIAAQRETGTLSTDELCGALLNLLFAGHDTTRYQFGWVVQLLVEHAQWQRLRYEPEAVPRAIEEAMRLEPSLHVLLRRTIEDIEYRDLVIPAGTPLILNTYAANRDPEMFPEPDQYDITRENAGRHLTFGNGGHMCLGHLLARSEMAEALNLFLERFPELGFAGAPAAGAELSAMSGAESVPMRGRARR